MKLTQNLKMYRHKKHFTQNKLANKLHVSRKTVSNWENGRSQPSFQTLIKLGKIYNKSVANLLGDKPNKPNKAILISYYLNIILLILNYILVLKHLHMANYLQLFIFINLVFLFINCKKWQYIVKNKFTLIIILIISLINMIANIRLYLRLLIRMGNHSIPFQLGFMSAFTFKVIVLTSSFFITLILSKNIKFLFKKFK